MIIHVEYTISEVICSMNSTGNVKRTLAGTADFCYCLFDMYNHVIWDVISYLFRKVQQEEKESRVQTAKPHKPHSGEEIIMANPCVMHVAFITNYIV